MNKYLITCSTNWCGMDNSFTAIAKTQDELDSIANELAYENFTNFGGFDLILELLYPEEDEYTEDMMEDAVEVEGEYYGFTIDLFDEDEDDWDDYELVYNSEEESSIR